MTDLEEVPTPDDTPRTTTGRRRPNWRDATKFQRERDAARDALRDTQRELVQVREALEQVSGENDTLRIQNANQADLRAALTDEHPVMTRPPGVTHSTVAALVALYAVISAVIGYAVGAR